MKTGIFQFFIILIVFILGFPPGSGAQEIMKHPRVVELEDSLKDSASEYVRTRFPSIPFMVSVRVDPMRRISEKNKQSNQEDLPYFESDDSDEMIDEWDNPQVPIKALINRVKRIQVSISIPTKLKEAEVNEMKDGIFQVLHLTPARDEIEISRRDWVLNEVPWLTWLATGLVVFVFLGGMLFINRASANKIAKALTEMKLTGGSNSSGNMAASISPKDLESKSPLKAQSQEFKFNDPLKMKELAARYIQFLVSSKQFPNHQDIFVLDRLGKDHPDKLGALLSEFPAEMQRKLFSYSSEFHWIEALNSPGFLDFKCLETLQTLTQNPRENDNLDLDHTILSVWRLHENRTQFLRGLSKDEAFALLSDMPKSVAVSEARKCFPGSWAAILDPGFKAQKISSQRMNEIQAAAVKLLPLNDLDMVKRYRAEKDLLDYLLVVDPVEERDIYGASPETSLIHKFRPPFYLLLEQDTAILQKFVPTIGLDQWGLALFNLPKSERSKVDSHFNEKQRFLLIEMFKKYDSAPPEKSIIGRAREQIAISLQRFLMETTTASPPQENPTENGDQNDETQNAA